jgi:hypothetical protein
VEEQVSLVLTGQAIQSLREEEGGANAARPGGGFGEATWTKEGDKWTVKTTARLANGKKASATNILIRIDNDHATWQITRLTVDGETMPDQPPVKLKRVKDDQP